MGKTSYSVYKCGYYHLILLEIKKRKKRKKPLTVLNAKVLNSFLFGVAKRQGGLLSLPITQHFLVILCILLY